MATEASSALIHDGIVFAPARCASNSNSSTWVDSTSLREAARWHVEIGAHRRTLRRAIRDRSLYLPSCTLRSMKGGKEV
jgi:hypothetical protein